MWPPNCLDIIKFSRHKSKGPTKPYASCCLPFLHHAACVHVCMSALVCLAHVITQFECSTCAGKLSHANHTPIAAQPSTTTATTTSWAGHWLVGSRMSPTPRESTRLLSTPSRGASVLWRRTAASARISSRVWKKPSPRRDSTKLSTSVLLTNPRALQSIPRSNDALNLSSAARCEVRHLTLI